MRDFVCGLIMGSNNVTLIILCGPHVTVARCLSNAAYEEWLPDKERSCAPCLTRSHGQPTKSLLITLIWKLVLRHLQQKMTKRRGRASSIPALYSGGPGFKSRATARLSWRTFTVIFRIVPDCVLLLVLGLGVGCYFEVTAGRTTSHDEFATSRSLCSKL
jgi:hypothetical protein